MTKEVKEGKIVESKPEVVEVFEESMASKKPAKKEAVKAAAPP